MSRYPLAGQCEVGWAKAMPVRETIINIAHAKLRRRTRTILLQRVISSPAGRMDQADLSLTSSQVEVTLAVEVTPLSLFCFVPIRRRSAWLGFCIALLCW